MKRVLQGSPFRLLTALVCALALCRAKLDAQLSPAAPLDTSPAALRVLVTEAVRQELHVVDFKSGFVRYRLRTVNSKGDQTRDLIETPDGSVARLILRDDRPITPEQDAAERSRLQAMLDDPSAFHRHIHEEENGKRTAATLIQMLPDAMLYSLTPGQPQRAGAMQQEIALDYQPNPNWSPPTTLSVALTGLQGRLWIDARTHRLTHLECTVFRTINIGYGVLARVNPGGAFTVDQEPLPDGRLIVTHFAEQVELRALMVKSLHEKEETSASGFVPIQAMSYQDAIRRLLETPLPQ